MTMKRIKVDLSVVQSISDDIFRSGYVQHDSRASIVGFRSGILSIAVAAGTDDQLCFKQSGIIRDFELRRLLSQAYHEMGLFIDFSFQGEDNMYAYIYG